MLVLRVFHWFEWNHFLSVKSWGIQDGYGSLTLELWHSKNPFWGLYIFYTRSQGVAALVSASAAETRTLSSLGLPMQKIHQSAHLSPFCTRYSNCSHGLWDEWVRKSLLFPSKQLLLKVFAERGEEASRKHFSTRPLPEHESVIQNLAGGPSMQRSRLLR